MEGEKLAIRNSQFPSLLVEQNSTGKSGKAQSGAAFEVCARDILPELRSTHKTVDEVADVDGPAQRTSVQIEGSRRRKRYVDVPLHRLEAAGPPISKVALKEDVAGGDLNVDR